MKWRLLLGIGNLFISHSPMDPVFRPSSLEKHNLAGSSSQEGKKVDPILNIIVTAHVINYYFLFFGVIVLNEYGHKFSIARSKKKYFPFLSTLLTWTSAKADINVRGQMVVSKSSSFLFSFMSRAGNSSSLESRRAAGQNGPKKVSCINSHKIQLDTSPFLLPWKKGLQSHVINGAAPYGLPTKFKLMPEYMNDLGYQVWPLTQFFSVSFWWKLIDLPGGQINDPSLGKTLFFSAPPGNSLVSVSDPRRAF